MIAGSLQFGGFDRQAFYDIMYGTDEAVVATYARKLTEIQMPGAMYNTQPLAPGGRTDRLGDETGLIPGPGASGTPGAVYGTTSIATYPLDAGTDGLNYTILSTPGPSDENFYEIGVAESYCQYPDQIMPFDITLMASNEQGNMAVARIFGAELLNMGFNVSVDDMDMGESYTYIAQYYSGLHPMQKPDNASVNRFMTFGQPGSLSVGGLPGNEAITFAPFLG